MNEVLSIIGLVLAVISTGVLLGVLVRLRKWEYNLVEFISAQGEDEASPLAKTIDAIGQTIGKGVSTQIHMSLLGQRSADARQERAVEADLTEDLIAQNNPGLIGILNAFPKLKRRALRNPQALGFILDKLAQVVPGGVGGSGGNHNSDYKSRLNKYG